MDNSENIDNPDSTDASDDATLSTMSEGFKSVNLKFSLQDRNTQIGLGVAAVLVIVLIVVLARACGSGGDPVERLFSAAEEIGETLEEHADDVGDDDLYGRADVIIDAERSLRRNTDIDYEDVRELDELGGDAIGFATSIYWYMVTAAEAAIWSASSDQETSDAALEAARKAGEYLSNDTALSIGRSFAERMLEAELTANARRDDDESADEYREAAQALLDATEAAVLAEVDYWIKGAETVIEIERIENDDQARFQDSSIDDLQESLDEYDEKREDAGERFYDAADDFLYFRERVEWRRLEDFRPRLPW